jgi:hypothetical protein
MARAESAASHCHRRIRARVRNMLRHFHHDECSFMHSTRAIVKDRIRRVRNRFRSGFTNR